VVGDGAVLLVVVLLVVVFVVSDPGAPGAGSVPGGTGRPSARYSASLNGAQPRAVPAVVPVAELRI